MRLLMTLALCAAGRAAVVEPKAPPENAAAATPGSGWDCAKPDAARRAAPPKRPVSDEDVEDYAVELGCMADWLSKYGGKGKEAGRAAPGLYEKQRRRTRFLIAEIDEWGKSAHGLGQGAAAKDSGRSSQQHYLSGVLYYQKGDFEKARKEWKTALRLDPADADARFGLERIEKLYGK